MSLSFFILESFENNRQAILWFLDHGEDRVMLVIWRRNEMKPSEHHGQHNLCFHQCKVVPNAEFGSNTKRHECLWVCACSRNPTRKSPRVEFSNVFSPILFVLVQSRQCEFNYHVFGDEEMFQLHILCCYSCEPNSRWKNP